MALMFEIGFTRHLFTIGFSTRSNYKRVISLKIKFSLTSSSILGPTDSAFITIERLAMPQVVGISFATGRGNFFYIVGSITRKEETYLIAFPLYSHCVAALEYFMSSYIGVELSFRPFTATLSINKMTFVRLLNAPITFQFYIPILI